MAQVAEFLHEDQVSVVIDDDEEILNGAAGSDSDRDDEAESRSKPSDRFPDFTLCGMGGVREGTVENEIIKKSFLAGMGPYAKDAEVVAIHKNLSCGVSARARLETFKVFAKAVAEKRGGGGANIKYGWYGGSREEIGKIMAHGFSFVRCSDDFGLGVHLSPSNFPLPCVASSVPDESGLRHMLLCRVIMGNMEVIPAGSKQSHPSSVVFDTGVDNLAAPTRFIVWSAFMNSHIYPNYIVSFKAPCFDGLARNQLRGVRPCSPWLSFPALLSMLSKTLNHSKMNLVSKLYGDFRRNKISRMQMIQSLRRITGDEILVTIIKSSKNKIVTGASSSTSGGSAGSNSNRG